MKLSRTVKVALIAGALFFPIITSLSAILMASMLYMRVAEFEHAMTIDYMYDRTEREVMKRLAQKNYDLGRFNHLRLLHLEGTLGLELQNREWEQYIPMPPKSKHPRYRSMPKQEYLPPRKGDVTWQASKGSS